MVSKTTGEGKLEVEFWLSSRRTTTLLPFQPATDAVVASTLPGGRLDIRVAAEPATMLV
jgi:hypothetical protein